MRLVQVSLLPIGQQGVGISSSIGRCFSMAGGLCKFYANARGKQPIQRQLLLVKYKHACQSTLKGLSHEMDLAFDDMYG